MSSIQVGREVGGLSIDALVARGGSSVVYRAHDINTGENRAVKVLVNPDPSARQRLLREATLLAQLAHPALVRFHRLDSVGDDLVLVTEWIDGMSLSTWLRTRTLSQTEAVSLIEQIAEPLAHLHNNGIVHRDVNGSNVMRQPDGSLKLVDLGIGHSVGTNTLTNQDLVAGTPQYMAPEIIRGDSATPSSDQYSLAILAYELLGRRNVFAAGETISAALHHQINTVPAPLDEVDPTIPATVSSAVARALSKDPSERFDSIGDFARGLRSVGDPQPVPDPFRPDRSTPTSGTRRRALIGAGALAAIAVATLAFVGLGSRSESTASDSTAPTTLPARSASTAPGWSEGLAGQLPCNRLTGHDFANGSVPIDYFGNPPARERVVEQGGFDDSWALQVGIAGDYGQYAEIVEGVTAGETYLFRGWFAADGAVTNAEMGIELLAGDYETSTGLVSLPLDLSAPGFHEVRIENVPVDAAVALPYLYKDMSTGTLLADELVFGPLSSCFAEIGEQS